MKTRKKKKIVFLVLLFVMFVMILLFVNMKSNNKKPEREQDKLLGYNQIEKIEIEANNQSGVEEEQQETATTGERCEKREVLSEKPVSNINGKSLQKEGSNVATETLSVPTTSCTENVDGSKVKAQEDDMSEEREDSTLTQKHEHKWQIQSERVVECKGHKSKGEGEMFFDSVEDVFLHQMADECMSGWGSGLATIRKCTLCDAVEYLEHVHGFDAIEKIVYYKVIQCECGGNLNGGKDKTGRYYTALESWARHRDAYVAYGEPYDEHDTYKETSDSWSVFYQATKCCSCGWLPEDKNLLKKRDLVANKAVLIEDVVINGIGGNEL